MLRTLAQNCFVEPEGVEPSSKQATHKISTCLDDFNCRQEFGNQRTEVPAYPHEFRRGIEALSLASVV